jgi:hypothetical protein
LAKQRSRFAPWFCEPRRWARKAKGEKNVTHNKSHETEENVTGNVRHKAPMNAVERQRKHRSAVKKCFADMTPEKRFRYELYQFVQNYRLFHPQVTAGQVEAAMHDSVVFSLEDGVYGDDEERIRDYWYEYFLEGTEKKYRSSRGMSEVCDSLSTLIKGNESL